MNIVFDVDPGHGNVTAILHVLELLKSIMSEFPESSLKMICFEIMSLLDLRDVVITCALKLLLCNLVE